MLHAGDTAIDFGGVAAAYNSAEFVPRTVQNLQSRGQILRGAGHH